MEGVEMIGGYKVTPMKDGKYSVAVTNGNMGAFVTDEKGLEEFKAKYNKEQDTVELNGKKSSTAKKIGKGVASAIIPGLGQVLDGRWKDGLKDYATALGIVLAGKLIAAKGGINFAKTIESGAAKTPVGFYVALGACAALGIAKIANRIHSVVDAYKKG